MTFGEVKCQVKSGSGPQNLAAFRNAAVSLVRLAGRKAIAATLSDFAYSPRKLPDYLGVMKN